MNYKLKYEKDYGNVYTVYMHICPDGKRYIGMTRQEVSKRWHGGSGYRNQARFYKAIKKFGWENIEHKIILEKVNLETAGKKEEELIKKYDTNNPEHGYNTKKGGQTFGDHSEEFMEKLMGRMIGNTYCTGRKISESHIEALRKANLGSHRPNKFKGKKIHTEEQKRKLSELAKERWRNTESREKYLNAVKLRDMSGENNPMYGKKHCEETKNKIRQKAIGRKMSEDTRRKMSESPKRKIKVKQMDLNGNLIKIFNSCKEASESVSGNSTNICFCCKRNNRTYKGSKWRYADDIT